MRRLCFLLQLKGDRGDRASRAECAGPPSSLSSPRGVSGFWESRVDGGDVPI